MRTAQTHPQVASIHEAIVATRDPGLAHHVEDYGEQPIARIAASAIEASLDELDAAARAKELAGANRERAEHEALADAVNAVERMRRRNGRRVVAPLDAKAIDDIWRILKGLAPADGGAENDGAWR